MSESISNPELYHLNNTIGTLNLLEAMQAHQMDKILFSSTTAVYGIPKILPIPESHDTQPLNPYGQSKLAAEQLLERYTLNHSFSVICLRYFNAAGAAYRLQKRHHPETHLIPLSVQAALQGLEISIYGNDYSTPDGSCIRDYVHVLDLCHAHYLALNPLLKHTGFQVYNLGTQHGTSVMEVSHMTEQVCGQSIKTKTAPRRAGDPAILIADSLLAQQALGWKTQYSNFTTIISDTWNSFRERSTND